MIRVLWFAVLREQAGCAEQPVDGAGMRAADIYARLRDQQPALLPASQVRVAIDGAFAGWDTVVADGAELAFLPPFSGG